MCERHKQFPSSFYFISYGALFQYVVQHALSVHFLKTGHGLRMTYLLSIEIRGWIQVRRLTSHSTEQGNVFTVLILWSVMGFYISSKCLSRQSSLHRNTKGIDTCINTERWSPVFVRALGELQWCWGGRISSSLKAGLLAGLRIKLIWDRLTGKNQI